MATDALLSAPDIRAARFLAALQELNAAPILSVKEAASLARLSPDRIYDSIKLHHLCASRTVGSKPRWRILREDLAAFLAAQSN